MMSSWRQVRRNRGAPGIDGMRILTAISSKSYWRMPKTLATQVGMTNLWLKDQGLISVRDLWMKAHGYARARRVLPVREPPGADPHAGWCGEGRLEAGLFFDHHVAAASICIAAREVTSTLSTLLKRYDEDVRASLRRRSSLLDRPERSIPGVPPQVQAELQRFRPLREQES